MKPVIGSALPRKINRFQRRESDAFRDHFWEVERENEVLIDLMLICVLIALLIVITYLFF